jgi:hypothetical protein
MYECMYASVYVCIYVCVCVYVCMYASMLYLLRVCIDYMYVYNMQRAPQKDIYLCIHYMYVYNTQRAPLEKDLHIYLSIYLSIYTYLHFLRVRSVHLLQRPFILCAKRMHLLPKEKLDILVPPLHISVPV